MGSASSSPASRPAGAQAEREFAFTDHDFERVRTFIYSRAGIALNATKKDMVYGRLVRRLRELKLPNFAVYLDYIESSAGAKELEPCVNALTTNLTYFFREEHHFKILTDYVKTLTTQSEITVWCAAASTGEEPYSIAMCLLEAMLGIAHAPKIQVIATDLDTSVLRHGETGIYLDDAVAKLPPTLAKRYFDKQADGRWQAKDILRERIQFRQLNLIEENWPLRQVFDAIFCRNVMIYFDRATQLAVLNHFAPLVKPKGLLFVGHSENFYQASPRFHLLGKTAYERVGD